MCSYKALNVILRRISWCCVLTTLSLLSSLLEAQHKPLFGLLDGGGMPCGLIELKPMKKSSGWILDANVPYAIWAAPKAKDVQYWASAWRSFGPHTLGSTKRYIFNWDGASHGGRLATNPEITVATPILSPAYASLHVQNFDGINVWVIVNPLPPGCGSSAEPSSAVLPLGAKAGMRWKVYGCGMVSCTKGGKCGTAISTKPLTVVPSVHPFLRCASVDVHLPDGSHFEGFHGLLPGSVVITQLK